MVMPASIEMALALHQNGQLDQAEAMYREILLAEPNHFDALQLLATLALQRGDSAAAVELFDRAIGINPGYAVVYSGRGNALSNLERYEEALESYDLAIELAPDFSEAINNRGNSLFNLERFEEALEHYDRALEIQPDYVDALKNRASVLGCLGRHAEAQESHDRAHEIETGFASAAFHNEQGCACYKEGRLAESAESFRMAISLQPDYVEAFVNLGIVLGEQNELQEAEKCFRRALELAPGHAAALKNLAENLAAQVRHAEGKTSSRQAPNPGVQGEVTRLLPAAVLQRYRIRSLFQECILICVVNRVEAWWDFQTQHEISHCQSVALLRLMLRELVLRRAGDASAYLRLTRHLDQLENLRHEEDIRLSALVERHLRERRSQPLSFHEEGAMEVSGIMRPVPGEARQALLRILHSADAPPQPDAVRQRGFSVVALMDGLLALHAAETHPAARAMTAQLRASALEIWKSACECISASTNPGHIYQVTRMLWHFDLLPEARACQARFSPHSLLCMALDDWQRVRQENERYAAALPDGTGGQGRRHVVGITIWGSAYLDFFLQYHLPSLLAEGNLSHLSSLGQLVVSLVTDAGGQERIEQSALFSVLTGMAEVRFSIVDRLPSREAAMNDYFYMHYGLLDHHHVYLAHNLQASLVLMPPDTVISRNAFHVLASYIEAGNDCCTIACIEAFKDKVRPELERFRDGVALSAEPGDLAAIAVRYKTDYFRSITFREGQKLNAYPREFFWRVHGGYICHSLFMHPVILSARVMSRAFNPSHENVDFALLPRVLQGDGRIQVLDDAGELFILHCSDSNPREQEMSSFEGRISPEYGAYMLGINEHNFPVHRELFRKPQFFPVEDNDVPVSGRYLEESASLLAMFDMATGLAP